MKKKICIVPLVIFSLLLIGARPLKNFNSPSFFDLNEQAIIENGNFIENGVKMNYCSKVDIETEYKRLLKEFKKSETENLQFSTNKIMYKDSSEDIKVILWKENNKTMVEIIVINKNSSKSSLSLKKELEKLQNNNSNEENYFAFIKGKIEEESYEKTKEMLMDSIKKNTLEELDIQNGYVATARFKDNQRVNIGYMKYDSGRQIIMGTPIIFVTY
ncbi:hypothetical protein H7E67_04150 [Clostridium gasigenes]|uniref:hypothetical protein n=1 Tax=Clostridium gasigenes TaxID=94869 RepID=UPI001625DDD5|nr:hypothetical protein [Clostridium gasigenes]MBB6622615.1 hypothetical protein [Clostridium gasigenes]